MTTRVPSFGHITISATNLNPSSNTPKLDKTMAASVVRQSLVSFGGDVYPGKWQPSHWRQEDIGDDILLFRFEHCLPRGEFTLYQDGSMTVTREPTYSEERRITVWSVQNLAMEALLTFHFLRKVHERLGKRGRYLLGFDIRGAEGVSIDPDFLEGKDYPELVGRIFRLETSSFTAAAEADISDPENTVNAVIELFISLLEHGILAYHRYPLHGIQLGRFKGTEPHVREWVNRLQQRVPPL